jgi:hypothetical protein
MDNKLQISLPKSCIHLCYRTLWCFTTLLRQIPHQNVWPWMLSNWIHPAIIHPVHVSQTFCNVSKTTHPFDIWVTRPFMRVAGYNPVWLLSYEARINQFRVYRPWDFKIIQGRKAKLTHTHFLTRSCLQMISYTVNTKLTYSGLLQHQACWSDSLETCSWHGDRYDPVQMPSAWLELGHNHKYQNVTILYKQISIYITEDTIYVLPHSHDSQNVVVLRPLLCTR